MFAVTGTEAPDSGGGWRIPVRGGGWDGSCYLRVGLGHSRSEPAAVRVVWQHALWAGPSGWRGQTEGTAEHIWELDDRCESDAHY